MPHDISPTDWMLKGVNKMIQPTGSCVERNILSRVTLAFGSIPMGLASSGYNAIGILKLPTTIFKYTVGQASFKGMKIGDQMPGGFTWKDIAMHIYKAVAYFFASFIGVFVGIASPLANEKMHLYFGLKNPQAPIAPPPPSLASFPSFEMPANFLEEIKRRTAGLEKPKAKTGSNNDQGNSVLANTLEIRRNRVNGPIDLVEALPILPQALPMQHKKIEYPSGLLQEIEKAGGIEYLKNRKKGRLNGDPSATEQGNSLIQLIENKQRFHGEDWSSNVGSSIGLEGDEWDIENDGEDPYGDKYIQDEARDIGPFDQHERVRKIQKDDERTREALKKAENPSDNKSELEKKLKERAEKNLTQELNAKKLNDLAIKRKELEKQIAEKKTLLAKLRTAGIQKEVQ